jgi:hypothetical protein
MVIRISITIIPCIDFIWNGRVVSFLVLEVCPNQRTNLKIISIFFCVMLICFLLVVATSKWQCFMVSDFLT